MGYRDAWHANLGLTTAAAQEAYVTFAEGLGFPLPGEAPAANSSGSSDSSSSSSSGGGGGGGGLMGPVQSTLRELDGGLDSAGVSCTIERHCHLRKS